VVLAGRSAETPDDWQTGYAKSLGVFLNGDALPDPDRHGRRLSDDTFLLLFNAHYGEVSFLLPGEKMGQQWLTDLDTAAASTRPETHLAGTRVAVAPCSLQILRRVYPGTLSATRTLPDAGSVPVQEVSNGSGGAGQQRGGEHAGAPAGAAPGGGDQAASGGGAVAAQVL
jgi:hypothetical protein